MHFNRHNTWGISVSILLSAAVSACGGSGGGGSPIAEVGTMTVLAVNPPSGATQVPLESPISLRFSEPIDAATVTEGNFTVFSGSEQVAGVVSVNGSLIQFVPALPLRSHRDYVATAGTSIRGESGGSIEGGEFSWTFHSVDRESPTVLSTFPYDGLQFAVVDFVEVTFSEAMDPASLTTSTFTLDGPNGNTAGTISTVDAVVRFIPVAPLLAQSSYTATVKAGVRDLAGNPLVADHVWSFTTMDGDLPTVVSVTPAAGATGIGLNDSIVVQFSEPIDPTTIAPSTFLVVDEYGTSISSGGSFSVNGAQVTFSLGTPPFSRFSVGANYTVTLRGVIRDLYNHEMGADYSWSFQVQAGWSGGSSVEDLPEDVDKPRVTFDPYRKNAQLIWRQRDIASTSYNDVRVNTLSNYDSDPTAHVRIDSDIGSTNSSSIAIDSNGQAFAIWGQDLGGSSSILVNRSPGNTASLIWDYSASVDIDRSNADMIDPQISIGAGQHKWAIWRASGSILMYASRFSDSTQTWENPIRINSSTDGTLGPPQILAGPDGAAYAIWTTSNGNIHFNFRAPNENTWSSGRDTIMNTGSSTTNPCLALLNTGELFLFYQQILTGNAASIICLPVTVNYAAGTITRGAPLALDFDSSASGLDAKLPRVAVGPDDSIHLCFYQKVPVNTGSVYSLLYRRRLPPSAGATWVPIVDINDPDVMVDLDGSNNTQAIENTIEPQIVVDGSGRVFLVWSQRTAATGAYSIVGRERTSSWLAPVYLDMDGSANGQPATNPSVAVDRTFNRFFVTWQQANPGENVDSVFSGIYR